MVLSEPQEPPGARGMLGFLFGSSEWRDSTPAHPANRPAFQERAARLWHSHGAAWESEVCQVILGRARSVSPGRANGENFPDADAHPETQTAGSSPLHARMSVATDLAVAPRC